jgi:hypothetical protein
MAGVAPGVLHPRTPAEYFRKEQLAREGLASSRKSGAVAFEGHVVGDVAGDGLGLG